MNKSRNNSKNQDNNGAKNLSKIINKSVRFSNPSKNDFLTPLGRFRTPKSRCIEFFGSFLKPPRKLRGLQNLPKSGQDGPKRRSCWHLAVKRPQDAPKTSPRRLFGGVLGASGAVLGRKRGPHGYKRIRYLLQYSAVLQSPLKASKIQ